MAGNDQYLIPGLFPFSRLCGNPDIERRGVSDQVRFKPACSATKTSNNIEILHGARPTTAFSR